MSNNQIFDIPPKCPICKIQMKKLKGYSGASGAEWATSTVSSSANTSANLYGEKTVYQCPSCGKMLLE